MCIYRIVGSLKCGQFHLPLYAHEIVSIISSHRFDRRCRLGNSTVYSLNHSWNAELVLHISIKQLIFKTKCPIHPVFNCTTPSRRGNLAKRARIVHTSKKVTNNHSRTPQTTRRRRPQSTSSPQSSSHQPLLFSSSCAALHLQQCFSCKAISSVNPFFPTP